ncbi:MAG TPA: DUF5946 family protein [Planctomycetaceae bacterium]|jgi:hypothetical protein|nr:DUF5946 family protein [Planctomycetaceae bacterium]
MDAKEEAFHALCCYTLAHGSPSFIHQHVVDAFGAQDSREGDKSIRLTFALVGLYLHVERGWTGRQVQLAHMKLVRRKHQWPTFRIPDDRGAINAATVLAVSPGSERDQMIDAWCRSVWRAFSEHRAKIEKLLSEHGVAPVPEAPGR